MSTICLQLYFQPKFDVNSNTITGYEILLRNREYPPYYPATKMEQVYFNQEKHALFLKWLKKELKQVLITFPGVSLSINFSPIQLLYDETKQFFEEFQIHSDQLMIEVTEDNPFIIGAATNEFKRIEQKLEETLAFIRGKGYKISLDDVGTGQNSFERALCYAKYLNQIKFSIVKCLKQNASIESIDYFLKAWSQFAIENEIDFVIEGIEDKATSEKLKNKGMHLQQGYYFGKPDAKLKLSM